MEIDKTKLKEGLKTAVDIGTNVAKTAAPILGSVAQTAVPILGSVVNSGLGIVSQLISSINKGNADYNQPYTPSDKVTQYGNAVDSLKAPVQKPSQYQDYLQQTMDAILNKEDFKYDVNADALFRQYKDQYVLGGQMAMQDTMGQASSLTGGYGNSFAQTAGQQQYQAYLQQLTDKIPELYQLARESHDRDLSNLYNKYGLLSDAEQKEYSRFRDEKADFYTDRDFLANQYYNERDFDYGQYVDNRNFSYQQHRDDVSDQQWQDSFNRSVYESDRDFASEQYRNMVDDYKWQMGYNRDIYESDRNFNRATYESDRDYQYQLGRDAIADERYDEQWQNTLDRQSVADSQWKEEFNLASQKATSSKSSNSSGGNNNSGGNPTSNNSKLTDDSKPIDDSKPVTLKNGEGISKAFKDVELFCKNAWRYADPDKEREEAIRYAYTHPEEYNITYNEMLYLIQTYIGKGK